MAGRDYTRVHVDPSQDGAEIVHGVGDRVRTELLWRIGLADTLKPRGSRLLTLLCSKLAARPCTPAPRHTASLLCPRRADPIGRLVPAKECIDRATHSGVNSFGFR